MKSIPHFSRLLPGSLAVAALLLLATRLQAQPPVWPVWDNFADGNDAAWAHQWQEAYSTGQTWTEANGTYTLTCIANGLQVQGYSLGYVGSICGPTNYDSTVQVDLVTFPPVGTNAGFGILMRGAGFDAIPPFSDSNPPALVATAAYICGYLPEGSLLGNSPTPNGTLQFFRIDPIQVNPNVLTVLGTAANIDLDPNLRYTMSASCNGSTLVGKIWETGNPANVLATTTTTDTTYAFGRSGLFALNGGPMTPANIAFANYKSMPTILSSAQPNTGWASDPTAVMDPVLGTVTIPQIGAARFYALPWSASITSINLVGNNVVLTFPAPASL